MYTSPELAARDTQALTDLVSVVIPTETSILFTAVTLQEEEMVRYTPTSSHPIYGPWILPPLAHGVHFAIVALSGDLTGHRSVGPRWPHNRWRRPTNHIASHQHSTNYSLLILSPSRRSRPHFSASSQPYERLSLLDKAYPPRYPSLAIAKVQTTPGCTICNTASNSDEVMNVILTALSPST